MSVTGWKILTRDLRPPIQGGASLFNGTLPYELPTIPLDRSEAECGSSGYHFTRDLATAVRIAGLWPDGRPATAVLVEADDVIERGNKLRAATLRLVRYATAQEWRAAIRRHSESFGVHADRMTEEQIAWGVALGRPARDEAEVVRCLTRALKVRGPSWTVKAYPDAWAAWDAWDARAAWDAWAAWDARAARAALTCMYAALMGWTTDDPMLLTTGIRDAYHWGLRVALPTGPNELGYAMDGAR